MELIDGDRNNCGHTILIHSDKKVGDVSRLTGCFDANVRLEYDCPSQWGNAIV